MNTYDKDIHKRYAQALDALNPNKAVDRSKLDILLSMAKKDPEFYKIAVSKGYDVKTNLYNIQ